MMGPNKTLVRSHKEIITNCCPMTSNYLTNSSLPYESNPLTSPTETALMNLATPSTALLSPWNKTFSITKLHWILYYQNPLNRPSTIFSKIICKSQKTKWCNQTRSETKKIDMTTQNWSTITKCKSLWYSTTKVSPKGATKSKSRKLPKNANSKKQSQWRLRTGIKVLLLSESTWSQ